MKDNFTIGVIIIYTLVVGALGTCYGYKDNQVDKLRQEVIALEEQIDNYKTIACTTAAEAESLRDTIAWYEDILEDNFAKKYEKKEVHKYGYDEPVPVRNSGSDEYK